MSVISADVSCWGEILRTYPDRPWDPPNLLYNVYRVCFPEVKWLGVTLTTHPSNTEVKGRVQLHFYSHFVTPWQVIGRNLRFLLTDFLTESQTKILE